MNENDNILDEDDPDYCLRDIEPGYPGESYLAELDCEQRINELTNKLTQLGRATDRRAAKDPNDIKLPRAREVIAQLQSELKGWLLCYLESWRATNGGPKGH
jgi:hypothetical protein